MLGALQETLRTPAHVLVTWAPEDLGLDLAAAKAWAEAQREAAEGNTERARDDDFRRRVRGHG